MMVDFKKKKKYNTQKNTQSNQSTFDCLKS